MKVFDHRPQRVTCTLSATLCAPSLALKRWDDSLKKSVSGTYRLSARRGTMLVRAALVTRASIVRVRGFVISGGGTVQTTYAAKMVTQRTDSRFGDAAAGQLP